MATLERVCRTMGYPRAMRVDQGGEFVSPDLDLWACILRRSQPPQGGASNRMGGMGGVRSTSVRRRSKGVRAIVGRKFEAGSWGQCRHQVFVPSRGRPSLFDAKFSVRKKGGHRLGEQLAADAISLRIAGKLGGCVVRPIVGPRGATLRCKLLQKIKEHILGLSQRHDAVDGAVLNAEGTVAPSQHDFLTFAGAVGFF